MVVLARFNRNLRSRKISDILWGDLRLFEATDEAVEAPEDVVLSLGLPTSRVPMKQCVSAMILYGLCIYMSFSLAFVLPQMAAASGDAEIKKKWFLKKIFFTKVHF